MRNVQVKEGAIWYWEVRKREPVVIDDILRETTITVIEGAASLLASGTTPPPTESRKRCRACSLADVCEPDAFRRDHSANYIREMFGA